MLEDVRVNAAIDRLLGNATDRSGSERGDPSSRSTHRDRYNDWQRRREEEARSLLKSAQIEPNIRSGLYGVVIDLVTSLDDIDAFHAQFIPADMCKPRDLSNVGKQSAKMYPDKTRMSARKWKRESYAALQRRLKKDFSKTAKEVLQGTWDALPKTPADHTVQWWTNVFECESDRIDLCLPAPREVMWDLVKPITAKEVRHCLKGVTGSPGPDGISWYQIKHYLHPASIAPYFDNWLAAGRLPTQVKIGYTTLIPKEVGATEP